MLAKMFGPADDQTFGARVERVGYTVFKMWFAMLFVVGIFKVVGLAAIDFSTNIPLLGVCANYFWLHGGSTTLGEAIASPFAVWGVLGTVLFAILIEEPIFRCLPCTAASDESGKLRPRWGIFVVIVVSVIFFGLAHGHGYFSVMLQGVGGLFLAQLFLRNGPNTLAATLSVMAAHSLYNISVVVTSWVWFS